MTIRPASPNDAAAFNAMYNPFIIETPATFETMAVDEVSRRRWIEERGSNPRHPVFVAEGGGGQIVGFAGASAFDPREAYESSVKVSVFIALTPREKATAAASIERFSTGWVEKTFIGPTR